MGMILKKITAYTYKISPKEFVKKLGLEGEPTYVSYVSHGRSPDKDIIVNTKVK